MESGTAERASNDRAAVAGAVFSRYAERDIDRWRQLVGHCAVPVDPQWGTGRVEDVRWGTCYPHAEPYVQIRVRYALLGCVVFRAATFDVHHRSVTVSAAVQETIRRCEEAGDGEAERAAILERHSRALREASDRRLLARVDERRRRGARGDASGG